MTLFAINSVAYLLAGVLIYIAILNLPKAYRWIWLISAATCFYYAVIYFLAYMENIPVDNLADYTRTISALFPIQLAFLAWLFVITLKNQGK